MIDSSRKADASANAYEWQRPNCATIKMELTSCFTSYVPNYVSAVALPSVNAPLSLPDLSIRISVERFYI